MKDFYSGQAEQAVLGAIFYEPDLIHETRLLPEHFSPGTHFNIFYTMKDMAAKDIPIDFVTLIERVGNSKVSKLGGVSYLSDLAQSVPTVENFKIYEDKILDSWQRREIQKHVLDINKRLSDYETAQDALASVNEMVATIEMAVGTESEGELQPILSELYDNIEQASYNGGSITGQSTGYTGLDNMLKGLHPENLVIIGARPSVGKTAFALNIAESVSKDDGAIAAIFSIEMPGKDLLSRMVSSMANIPGDKMRTGAFDDKDWSDFTTSIGELGNRNLKIYQEPTQTLGYIGSKLRKLRRDNPDKKIIAIIDYLQLIQTPGAKGNNRNLEIGEISRGLKRIARDLKMTVVALSQLSRGVEQRQDKRPMMSDLRESGNIEQDADVIGFLYRDDYYDKQSEKQNVIEIIISKQRNGPTGTVELGFVKEYGKFINIDQNYGRD